MRKKIIKTTNPIASNLYFSYKLNLQIDSRMIYSTGNGKFMPAFVVLESPSVVLLVKVLK
jgi:hypothetical protein